MSMDRPRLVVGISGASGFQYGLKALQLLRAVGGVEVHLVLSKGAEMTRAMETAITRDEVQALADVVHPVQTWGPAFPADRSVRWACWWPPARCARWPPWPRAWATTC